MFTMKMTISRCFVVLVLVAGSSEGMSKRGESCVTHDRQQGTCISLRDCEEWKHLLVLNLSRLVLEESMGDLRRAICNIDNHEPLLCCSNTYVTTPMPTPRAIPSTDNRTVISVLPELRCGVRPLQNGIVQGLYAAQGAWPWMVLLRGNAGGRSFWFCGGTLISKRYVLTAAHCFKRSLGVNLEYARLGEHNINQTHDCQFNVCAPLPQDIPVNPQDIILHPSYENPCPECNDIALLRLSREATLQSLDVFPICLPLNPTVNLGVSVEEFQGKVAWAPGWGITPQDRSDNRRPSVLQQVQLPIQELSYCEFLKRNYPDPSMVICAGGDGKDTCKGDSGGALILANLEITRYYLLGVKSLRPASCDSQGNQGLYSSVHYYLPWIIGTMRP